MRPIAPLTAAVIALLLAPQPAFAASWVWPVSGEVITPYRNGDDPYAGGQHRGIDIAASAGTPVVAGAGGEVRFAGTAGSSGLTVSVRTDDGFDTSYLHLSTLSVRAGASVAAGDRLGAVGTTGKRSVTQPHLHFGVREAGSHHGYRDPLAFLPARPAAPPTEPRPAPAPFPAPAPMAPQAAPAPAPRSAPRRVPAGAPRRVPAGAPRRVPAGQPRRIPVGVPQHAPTGGPRLVPAGGPRRGSAGARHRPVALAPRAVTSRATSLAGTSGRADRPARPPSPATAHGREPGRGARRSVEAPRPPVATEASRGPDIGWALACAGLLLAAAVLGLTGDGRSAAARGRSLLTGALRSVPARR